MLIILILILKFGEYSQFHVFGRTTDNKVSTQSLSEQSEIFGALISKTQNLRFSITYVYACHFLYNA